MGATSSAPPSKIHLEETHSKLYSLMRSLHNLCTLYRIEYFIGYGTLLGAVREGKIIEWDDDIDIFMTRDNLLKLKRAFGDLRKAGPLRLDFRDFIWRVNFEKQYPYIDIFEIELDGDTSPSETRLLRRYIFAEEANRRRWGTSSGGLFLLDEVYPLTPYRLGALTLPGPSNYDSILKRSYGDYMKPSLKSRGC
jgi:hypothetical protein